MSIRCIARALLGAIALCFPVLAQGDYTARTTQDPNVDEKVLEYLLRPLKLEQVEVEAKAWLDRLAAKNLEISEKQVALHSAQGETRTTLANEIAAASAEQTRLVDRLRKTLAALKARGGDAKPYEDYVAASTGFALGDAGDVLSAVDLARTWLVSPEGGMRLGVNLVQFLLTLVAFSILARILAGLVAKTLGRVRNVSALLRDFFVNTVSKVTFFIGLVVALSMLEIDVTPFLAAIGAAGFVIGFALQGTLSNFAAGIMILIYRPYDIGHVVTVAGKTGKVDQMSLVSTTLRLFDNQIVIVPNGSIWGDVITNSTSEKTRRVDMSFGCGYGDDLQAVQRVLEEIVTSHPKVLADPAPVVKLHALADSSVNFVARPWARTEDYWDVFWDVTREVKRRFDEEGLTIPFPQRDVHVHQAKA